MIETNYYLLIVALMTVGTIVIRGSFIAFSGKIKDTQKLRNLFSYIPAAIFPAIIIPGSFYHPQKERFVILLAAIVVSYFIRNTLFIVSFGLILLYLATQVF